MVGNKLVLSIFPGIDLLGRAFEEEGFCVVRGPDTLWGGDIRSFHPPAGVFEGVIGGPPCQAFSRMRRLLEAIGKQPRYGNLIPEFERVVEEAQPQWFLMENVPEAPVAMPKDYFIQHFILNNRWVGGVQFRVRRFTFGSAIATGSQLDVEIVALETNEWSRAVLGDQRQVPFLLGKNGKPKRITVLASDTPTPGQRRSGEQYMTVERMLELQGFPTDLMKDSPFRKDAQKELIGNGVPLPMGRAVAKAIRKALD